MSDNEKLHESYQQLSSLLDGVYNDAKQQGLGENIYPISEHIRELGERYGDTLGLTQGGMKKIEVVEDCITGHPIAKATMRHEQTPENIECFFREARITAGLEHPNIVPIYDIGFDKEQQPFFTMKLLTGDSLQTVLTQLAEGNQTYLQRYDINSRLNIFLKICDAVSYAHSKGIVHLDLKPDNIQLGEFGEVYVCDWGLSKVLASDERTVSFDSGIYNLGTLHGQVKGTPGFMAPEQVKSKFGDKNIATDVYSLGALLFSLLNLSKPITSASLNVILKKTVNGELDSWNEKLFIPYSLKTVCQKAMAVRQQKRYASARELSAEITAYLNGFATAAEGAGFISQLKLLIKRNRKVSFSIIVSVALIILISSLLMVKVKEKEQRAVEALRLYKQQLQETEAAYGLYSSEREASEERLELLQETEAIQQHNLPTLLLLSNHNIFKGIYDNAIKLLKVALRNHPNNKRAIKLIATAYMYEHNFAMATEYFEKLDDSKSRKLATICRKYASLTPSGKLNYVLYLELLEYLANEKSLRGHAIRFIEDLPVVEYRHDFIPLLRKSLEVLNPKQEDVSLIVERKGNLNYVDLSNNYDLTDIAPIQKLYLHSVNLSHTAVSDLSPMINKPNLYYLDISYSKVTSVQIIKQFPNLKELTISQGQFSQKQIDKLPRGLVIIYR